MTDTRRILLVSASNFDRDTRVLKMARSLHEAGWDVTCLGLVEHAGDQQREERPETHIIRVVTSTVPFERSASEAPGSPSTPPPRRPPLRRLLALVSRIGFVDDLRIFAGRIRENLLFARVVKGQHFDAALVCNPSTLLTGVILKRRGARLVYDVREVWTGQSTNVGALYRWLYDAWERVLVPRVDAVTVVNDLIGDHLEERFPRTRPLTVMNGAWDCTAEEPTVSTPVRLFFQGRFAADRGLSQLVRLMPHLRGLATLTLQGFEGVEAELHRLVEELALADIVHFEPPCLPADTVSCAARYDVGVISYPPTSLNLQLSSPNKLFDYLGGGLAVASSDVPFCRRIIERYRCGVIFDARDPDSMLDVLKSLCGSPERVAEMRRAARAACAETSWSVQGGRLVQLLHDLTEAV